MIKSDLVILQLFRRLTDEQREGFLELAKCMVQPILVEADPEKEAINER